MASLMDLMIKIGAQDNASGVINKVASTTKSVMKGAAVAVGAVAAGITAMTKASVAAYADYEQLVGGVETLFGAGGKTITQYMNSVGDYSQETIDKYRGLKAAQEEVLANADNAYKTAGLSANEYMETVTSFSAALIASLGGDTGKAAEYADKAIVDMADNANKMGSSMESIQNAYQGFAKQNYTMLDNLKLGYGGTKSEMERLLADAGKLAGKKFDLSSYADVVEAIHTIQTEMGITGTTALEAEKTISGSINMMKSAWKNWLTGLGDSNADMKKLTSQLLNSGKTVLGNVKPIVENVFTSVKEIITEDAPEIIDELLNMLVEGVPQLLEMGGSFLSALIDGIINNLGSISESATEIITKLCEGIQEAIPGLAEAIPQVISAIADFLINNSHMVISTGVQLIVALAQGFIAGIPDLLLAALTLVGELVMAIGDELGKFEEAGQEVVEKIKAGIKRGWDSLVGWFSDLWDSLFGNLHVDVDVAGSGGGSGNAIGLDYVPHNDFMARLHQGEAVLTRQEAEDWRRGKNNKAGVTIVQNIQSVPQTAVQLASATAASFERARWII